MQRPRAARAATVAGLTAGLLMYSVGPSVAVVAGFLLAAAWHLARRSPELRRAWELWQRGRTVARSQQLNRTAARQATAAPAPPQQRAA
ncbi:MAG: hypothetical protein IT204_10585 [Fimbriimonadaceae bacterium]|nr:hypothetical protein [Fimbriimonadaceae bacterium]